jgi:late competence protein required for DNA uptake (superfamily II DNA/RNA helicase)
MQNDIVDIDIELYQIAKNDTYVKCVSCDDWIKEDSEYTFVCDDIYCESCLIDADLIAYRYG